MQLFSWLWDKALDFIDQAHSMVGNGSKANQALLENLVHRVLEAKSKSNLDLSLNELKTFLADARYQKLNFTVAMGSSCLLNELLRAAKTKPGVWDCLEIISKKKAHTSLGWNDFSSEKEQTPRSSTPFATLISLAYQDDKDNAVICQKAQELLLTLFNEKIFLDWNTLVAEENKTGPTALWILMAAAYNGQPWAVTMSLSVINQADKNLNWNICWQNATALALATHLAVTGKPQYLKGILEEETVFTQLNFNVKFRGKSLIDTLVEGSDCEPLAKWILLAKKIDETILEEKGAGVALSKKLADKTRRIAKKCWQLQNPESKTLKGGEKFREVPKTLLLKHAQDGLRKELTGIPEECQPWIIRLAILQGKFTYQPKSHTSKDNEIRTQALSYSSQCITLLFTGAGCVKNLLIGGCFGRRVDKTVPTVGLKPKPRVPL